MSTSRTGTASWKKLVRAKRYAKQQEHVPRCPRCRVALRFDVPNQPCSAELDHLVPASHGGEDTWENTEIVCHTCNRSKGNRLAAPQRPVALSPIRNTGRF